MSSIINVAEAAGLGGSGDALVVKKLKVDELIGYTDPNVISMPSFNVAMNTPWLDVYTTYGTRDAAAINSAVVDIGFNQTILFLDGGTWTIDNNVNTPTNAYLKFARDTLISVQNGMTLTIYGGYDDVPYDIFEKVGTGAIILSDWQCGRNGEMSPPVGCSPQGVLKWWITTAGGSVNAITATYYPTILYLNEGLTVCCYAAGANTGPTTFNIPTAGNAGDYPIYKGAGQALDAGDIPGDGYPMWLQYNEHWGWQLLNPYVDSGSISSLDTTLRSLISTSSKVIQTKKYETNSVISISPVAGTSSITSAPQITEGGQVFSHSITPTSISNKIKIEVNVGGSMRLNGDLDGASGAVPVVSLYKAGGTNPIASVIMPTSQFIKDGGVYNFAGNVSFTHYEDIASLTVTTFYVRVVVCKEGAAVGYNFTVNGNYGSTLLGGYMSSSMTVSEVQMSL
jgi:hypothetical protein